MAVTRKVVLVTRPTRLQQLVDRHHTKAQARFYLEGLGADFGDYLLEDAAYAASLAAATQSLQAWGRYQVLDRTYLPNFVFGRDDIVVALGQDGLVANTLKYLSGQPLVGINPEPARFDGVLLPFEAAQLGALLPAVAADARPVAQVTIAQASLSDGQVLRAVNDLFIGPRSHTSALYDISHAGRSETQSSSGLIVSTGLGSTAWFKSVVAGSVGIVSSLVHGSPAAADEALAWQPMAWDSAHLVFAVREPFASRSSQATLLFGEVNARAPLTVRSRMPEHGVIFSDGIEADYLHFTAGMQVQVGVCSESGYLVQ